MTIQNGVARGLPCMRQGRYAVLDGQGGIGKPQGVYAEYL